MDPLTHALTGAVISDCWFRRRLGPVATPFALVMGAIPDVDAAAFLISVESAWANHRGVTHGFFTQIVAAPIFGYAGYRLSRRWGAWLLWSLLALLCLFSHTILDLATSWGTMPFAPFSNARCSWDIAPILDLFVLSLGAASFVFNRVLRWERVDDFINPLRFPVVHRHPGRSRAADVVGKIGVLLIIVYLLIGCLQNRQTVRVARDELAKRGISPVEIRALPIMFTSIAWNIAARTADGTVYNAVYSSYAPEPMRFTEHKTLPASELAPVLASPLGRLFAWYAQGMFTARRIESGASEEGERIALDDRRFFGLVNPDESRFTTEFTLAPDGGVADARILRRNPHYRVAMREEAERLWELIWSGSVRPGAANNNQ